MLCGIIFYMIIIEAKVEHDKVEAIVLRKLLNSFN